MVTKDGFQPNDDRIQYIKNLKKPQNITQLRRVLGIFNFYRRFSKGIADHMAPLNNVLKGHTKAKDRTPIQWNEELVQAFENCKNALVNFTTLQYPRNDAKLILTIDASQHAVGAVLEQIVEEGRQPLGFFSQKLTDSQQKWSTYDRELFAVYAVVQHFEFLLEANHFTIATDHRPLTYMFTTKKRNQLDRRNRYVEYIAQFTNKIVHISGLSNVVADALSRHDIDAIRANITIEDIAHAQKNDNEINELRTKHHHDHIMRECITEKGNTVLCSFFNNVNRPVVPKQLRQAVFRQIHDLAHAGSKASVRMMRSRYYWPKLSADIMKWQRACDKCQRSRIGRHTKAPIQHFPPSDRFEHVHTDIVGPMKSSDGRRYVITFIDHATRWIEAVPVASVNERVIAETFYETWVSRYGIPARVTTDRGGQYRSTLFRELCRILGADHVQTTSYHPEGNGIIERMH